MELLTSEAATAADSVSTIEVVGAPDSFVARTRAAFPPPTRLTTRSEVTRGRGTAPGVVLFFTAGAPLERDVRALASVAPTIIVTEQVDLPEALATLEWGADGYIDARVDPRVLRSAALGVLRGELAFPRIVIGILLRAQLARSTAPSLVSPRQREILELIAGGATDKDLAQLFNVQVSTAQKQVSRLLRQLGARNRAAAVARLPLRRTD